MTATITRAAVVGGHDGRAEIEVELTYTNGGTATIALDEDACTASLDRAGVRSIDDLVGQPWTVVLPGANPDRCVPSDCEPDTEDHARSRHS